MCVAAQHPSKVAQNPPRPPPSCRSFDHDRVAENRTSFGLSYLPLPINMCPSRNLRADETLTSTSVSRHTVPPAPAGHVRCALDLTPANEGLPHHPPPPPAPIAPRHLSRASHHPPKPAGAWVSPSRPISPPPHFTGTPPEPRRPPSPAVAGPAPPPYAGAATPRLRRRSPVALPPFR